MILQEIKELVVVDIRIKGRGIDPQAVVQPLGLQAQFVINRLFRVEGGGRRDGFTGLALETAALETLGYTGVDHAVDFQLVFTDQPPGDTTPALVGVDGKLLPEEENRERFRAGGVAEVLGLAGVAQSQRR